jgi:hypothetical protein
MTGIAPEALHGKWLRAPEEDTETELVYRPASHPLPRSRGREGLELRPDGTAVQVRPGPTDIAAHRQGRWRLSGNALHLELEGERPSTRVLEVVDVSPSRITVKR